MKGWKLPARGGCAFGTEVRSWSVLTVIVISMFLILPVTGFAATPPEPTTRWPHCETHNLNYQENDSVRCGESDSGTGVLLAQSDDYGPFLCGVCQTCMDRGVCTLTDTMIVVGNVGNFILGIVGSLALLMFVIGGVLILVSQGEKGRVDRGRKFIFASAVGVAVTLGAVLILRTLLSTLESGSPGTGSSGGIVCDGTNDGAACGQNSVCESGVCVEQLTISDAEIEADTEELELLLEP